MPFSRREGFEINTKPLLSPSVPGHVISPAPVYHLAVQTLAAKSYTVPETGVAGVTGVPGVVVLVAVPGLMPVPDTLISTQNDFVPAEPIPNGTPVLFFNFQ